MDPIRAKVLAKDLKGLTCSGWKIEKYINCGKSAIVLKAKKGTKEAAIKIFDPELTDRFGAEIQKERIEREKLLIGKVHPNLVRILDGGFWKERKLYFLVMEFLPWKNLAEVLPKVPTGLERSIIAQVAAAAQFLEKIGICHRDIKPENIGIDSDFQQVKLLDLGVIKPQGAKAVTDGTNSKIFIGTLKYSPPEFLLRKEKDTKEGWRAVSFYQLGGVLHDLIMRKSLFSEYEDPYGLLVNAIQLTKPEVESESVSPALVELANFCLLKNPETRLKLVSWESFEKEPEANDSVASYKLKISQHIIAKHDGSVPTVTSKEHQKALSDKLVQYSKNIEGICRLECVENPAIFPPIEIQSKAVDSKTQAISIQFDPSDSHGLEYHLLISLCLKWIDADNDVVQITAVASISGKSFTSHTIPPSTEQPFYKGIYTLDSVRRKTIPILYRALSQAQQPMKIRGSESQRLDIGEEN